MTSKEFTEWRAFFRVQPWPDDVPWLAIGRFMALIANVYRDPKKRKTFSTDDFYIDWWKEVEAQKPRTQEDLQREMEAIARIYNAAAKQGG